MSAQVTQFPMRPRGMAALLPTSDPQPAPPAAGSAFDAFALTLAFERIVDQVLTFQQQRGALPDGYVSPAVRHELRAGLTRLLNELDPVVRSAAEARTTDYARQVLPLHPNFTEPAVLSALFTDVFEEYRRGLRQVPLRGVGTLV